jgi:tetratricopeptide (TPR) repeat protein
MRHYDAAFRLRPDLCESHNNRGLVLSVMGRSKEAAASFREAVRLKPTDGRMWQNLGVELGRSGAVDEAIAALRTAVERLDATRAGRASKTRALDELGLQLARKGNYKEALATFEEALRLNPRDAMTHDGIGRTYRMMNRPNDAIAAFRAAIDDDPRYLDAAIPLGRTLAEVGDDSGAVAAFSRAAHILPDAAVSLVWLLAASPNAGVRRPDKALAIAQQLRPEGVTAAKAWDAIAAAFAANDRFREAAEANEKAVVLCSRSSRAGDPEVERSLSRLRARGLLYSQRQSFLGPLSDLTADVAP